MDFDMEHVDNEYDEVEVDDEQECAEIVDEPKVGMTFSSAEEILSYYMKYGKQEGFGVCKRNSKQDDDGNVRWFTLVCVREGTSKSKAANVLKPRQTKKIGCMARINVTMNNESVYTLTKVNLEHTHICSLGKIRHFKYFKKVDARVAKRLEINDEAGIRMSKNFKSLVVEAGGYDKLSFGEKECRNYIDKARQLRLRVGGVEALCNYFQEMQKKNPDFYFSIDVDHDMRLKNVFWEDARSRAMYESFGDVITFDTTYLTNAYKMPFAPFVGVNHHGQSILFGCGLISNEDAHTFEWLFNVLVDQDHLDVKCSCKFRGILCRHALRILALLGKSTVPSKYILDRWKKDIKRKYTFVKNNYESSSNHDGERYDKIQNSFYELCSNASKAKSSCVKLINQIEQLKLEYPGTNSQCGSEPVDPHTSMEGRKSAVLSPLVVRSKGRPPSKRKAHPVEKVLKKRVQKEDCDATLLKFLESRVVK
ncbi:protein FAR-RED IMPAIRED RESPONSE 1-like [Juglans regia]|uniref:Protein FAR-RED IMPAIRED RESPONSE 1-like n=1 Tax=Juglans regia TaxID=51240 RepID=A0A2I4FTM5_JUGRE|nr:protein FAR-RED IMPAIRED RESPONSE 1-like [Juglans regia]